MNASMQVHHTKLWLAGNDGNWALAAYELKEIKETVEDIQTYSPKWHGIPVAQMVKGLDPSINSLNQGVIAKNSIKFNADFREFTAACNACHVAANQPEIKIMVPLTPDANKFADQDFTAGGRSQK